MRSLYFKIFLWFWLAMALVGTAFVVSTVTLQSSEAEVRWRSFVRSGLILSGQSAIEAYEAGGRPGLSAFFARMERRNNVSAHLFDERLQELSGRPTPPGVEDLLTRATSVDELAVEERESSRLVALQLTAPEGAAYVLLVEMDWPFRGAGGRGRDRGDAGRRGERGGVGAPSVEADPGGGARATDRQPDFRGRRTAGRPWYVVWLSAVDQPGALALRLLLVFLTAGILCYGLARYLTSPVLRLRDATHKLAGGDLSVRVGAEVTGRRDEIAELGRDFDLMAERVESLLTTQRQLLSDVSHELRSPLARLNVALALARRRSGADAATSLDRIESEAELLNSLIGKVLALARFESGTMEQEFAAVDLCRLVRDVAVDADFEADPRGISVSVRGAPAALSVNGSEPLLRSAIENVVRNAVRYTAPGTAVEVELVRDRDEAVISVRDHGAGVPEEQLEDLFQPFYRIADSRDRGSGGTGLGLSITDRAVRIHGGTVRAENAADGGLIVEIRLPVEA
jgi:signal transduction histidine kinase